MKYNNLYDIIYKKSHLCISSIALPLCVPIEKRKLSIMRTRLIGTAILAASTLTLVTACGSNAHRDVNADKGVSYGSSAPTSSGTPSGSPDSSDEASTSPSEPAATETETETEPPASSYIMVASCNREGTIRRVDWLNGETGLTVKSKYFTVDPTKYSTLSTCDGSTVIGAQERTAYNKGFTKLVGVQFGSNNKQYIGTINGSDKPGKSTFTKLSGTQQFNTPGSFDRYGRVLYKDYSDAANKYRLCTITTKGTYRSCRTLSGPLADDHRIYLPKNSRQAKTAGHLGLVVAPGGSYAFMWNGSSLQFGAPSDIGTSAAHTSYTSDGSMMPYPFEYLDRTHFLAFDSDGIYYVEISRDILKMVTLYKSTSYSIADPVLSPDKQTIAFRAVDGSISSLMLLSAKDHKKAVQARNFSSDDEGNLTIMDWISAS